MTLLGRTGSPLAIRLFGSFEVCRDGQPLPPLRSRKGQWLLALLALRAGQEVERTWLAGTLWPDSSEAQALANLRNSLTDLRGALGPEETRLSSPTPHTLCLDLAGAAVDVAAFDAAIAQEEAPPLEQALLLYRGPLLEGCNEEWAFQARQVREQAYLAALERLAEHAMAAGDPAAAERHLRRAVAVDPLRETAQRALMEALTAGGNHAAAALAYRDLRQRLHRELNAEPDPETQALYQHLRAEARDRAGVRGQAGTSRTPSPAARVPAYGPPAFPHNLPLQLTRFIGRESQIAEIEPLLTEHRLLTLTGAGGCGKTRLALQVAADLVEEYPDGIWLVELAPLADPALVPQTVATTLGVREEPGRPLTATLADHLRPKSLLLLLDNCEHLLLAGAQLAEALLRACPSLRILATSREGLGIAGELTYRVPSLSLPPVAPTFQSTTSPSGSSALREYEALPPVERLVQYEAVSLFIERAGFSQPGFAVTPQNAAVVAQVCQRLDGIPLAIELAAVRVRALPVEQIAARLDDRFRLLTGGSRTALPRQQTLRALIDWSYDLLTGPEQALVRRLSVFAGGWTLEAAEGVCAGEEIEAREVVDGLAALVAKSLVQYEAGAGGAEGASWGPAPGRFGGEADSAGGEFSARRASSYVRGRAETRAPGGQAARYRMLETVRQYSRDRLGAGGAEGAFWGPGPGGEAAAVRDRHRDWFLALAERAEPHLCQGADQVAWLDCLETEHGNLRAALEACTTAVGSEQWAVGSEQWGGTHEVGRGSPSGSKAPASAASLSELLTAHCSLPTASEAGLRLAAVLTSFWIRRGHLAEARQWFDRVLAGDAGAPAAARGGALAGAMRVAFFLDDSPSEASLAAQGLALGRETGDQRLTARSFYHASHVAIKQSQSEQAQALGEEGLAVARELGDKSVIASLLRMLGWVAASRGDDERERVFHSESLALFRELEDTGSIAYQLANLGWLALRQGDYERAGALYSEALALSRELNDRIMIAIQLRQMGDLALAQDDLSTAQARYSEATALARELNLPSLAWYISQLWEVACRQSDYETATALHQESLALWQGRDEQGGIAMAQYQLGTVAQQQGDYPSARAHHAQSLALWQEAGDDHGVAECLEQLAAMAAAQGQPLKAARIFGAAAPLRVESGMPLWPVERLNHDRQAAALRAALRATLDEAAFAAAWAAGRAMPLERVIASALTGR